MVIYNLISKFLSPFAPLLLVSVVLLIILLRVSYNTQNDLQFKLTQLQVVSEINTIDTKKRKEVNKKTQDIIQKVVGDKLINKATTLTTVVKVERIACKHSVKGNVDATTEIDVLNLPVGSDVVGLLREADGSISVLTD